MVKICLMVCIFLICTILGFAKGESYKKRLNQLKEYKNIVIFLQNEILYNNTPLPEALNRVSEKAEEPYSSLIKNISEKITEYDNEKDLFGIVKHIYSYSEENFYLNGNDKKSIMDFVKYLGSTGVFGQEKIFELAVKNADINIEEANETAKKNIKLWRELGLCFGAMAAILII